MEGIYLDHFFKVCKKEGITRQFIVKNNTPKKNKILQRD